MRALAIVHQRDAGPGVFAEEARARGVELDLWHRAESEKPRGERIEPERDDDWREHAHEEWREFVRRAAEL